jgi:coenzyme PQQ precursor peptide PqqA
MVKHRTRAAKTDTLRVIRRAGYRLSLQPQNEESLTMREWRKPTVEETECGMEVTSYLPAELDRA